MHGKTISRKPYPNLSVSTFRHSRIDVRVALTSVHATDWFFQVRCANFLLDGASIFHSIAANGNTGLSGQAQWLPVAATTRNHAPKSPTIPSGHATTRVKRVSAPKGPAHLYSCQHFEYSGRRQRKYCDAANCPY